MTIASVASQRSVGRGSRRRRSGRLKTALSRTTLARSMSAATRRRLAAIERITRLSPSRARWVKRWRVHRELAMASSAAETTA
jgi:hypothetical protein